MHYQLPLEQLVRLRHAASQVEFAWEAMAILDESEEARFHPSPRGLQIFVAHEAALRRPLAILADRYHEALEVPPPRVRCVAGRPVLHPVMRVRARVPASHARAAVETLRGHGATVLEECRRGGALIVRAEAPLADLLGLEAALEKAAGKRAELSMTLDRYEPRGTAAAREATCSTPPPSP